MSFNDTFGTENEMMNVAIEEFYVLPQRFNVFADLYDTIPGWTRSLYGYRTSDYKLSIVQRTHGLDTTPELKRCISNNNVQTSTLMRVDVVKPLLSPEFVEKVNEQIVNRRHKESSLRYSPVYALCNLKTVLSF